MLVMKYCERAHGVQRTRRVRFQPGMEASCATSWRHVVRICANVISLRRAPCRVDAGLEVCLSDESQPGPYGRRWPRCSPV